MEFVILAFATFGIAEAINNTDGPFKFFYWLKHLKYNKLFNCFTCLSFWVGLALAAITAPDLATWFMYGVGAAGASIFLDYVVDLQ